MTKYAVVVRNEENVLTFETNDFNEMAQFVSDHSDERIDILDGYTGEVRATFNDPEHQFADDEIAFGLLGWMISTEWGEPEPDPREEIIRDIMEVCEEFGVRLTVPNGFGVSL